MMVISVMSVVVIFHITSVNVLDDSTKLLVPVFWTISIILYLF